MKRKFPAVLAVLAMFCALTAPCALAAEATPETASAEPVWEALSMPDPPRRIPTEDGETGDLFLGYLEKTSGVEPDAVLLSDAGSRLTGLNAELYAMLREDLAEIAAGRSLCSDIVYLPAGLPDNFRQQLEDQYTREELDAMRTLPENYAFSTVETWTADQINALKAQYGFSDGEADSQIVRSIAEKMRYGLDGTAIINALMADCPLELYWYDKTAGYSAANGYSAVWSTRTKSTGELVSKTYTVAIPQIEFTFAVAEAFRDESQPTVYEDGSVEYLMLNGGMEDLLETVRQAADEIVKGNQWKSDFAMLEAYKNEICDLVTYNHEAAGDPETPYGNPWQLLWVFDGDPDTNVVCEGYSKAFQYLCDLSAFRSGTEVYTVSGYLGDGTGSEPGPHMWNHVRIGGKYYLADLTNCDEDSVGYPDLLFLKGIENQSDDPADPFFVKQTGRKYTTYEWLFFDTVAGAFVNPYGPEVVELSEEDFDPASIPPVPVSAADFLAGIDGAAEKPASEIETVVHPYDGNAARITLSFHDPVTDLTLPVQPHEDGFIQIFHGPADAAELPEKNALQAGMPTAPGAYTLYAYLITQEDVPGVAYAGGLTELLDLTMEARASVLSVLGDVPETVAPGESFSVTLSLRDADGTPLSDVAFEAAAENCAVPEEPLVTGADGTYTLTITAGTEEGPCSVTLSYAGRDDWRGGQAEIVSAVKKEETGPAAPEIQYEGGVSVQLTVSDPAFFGQTVFAAAYTPEGRFLLVLTGKIDETGSAVLSAEDLQDVGSHILRVMVADGETCVPLCAARSFESGV